RIEQNNSARVLPLSVRTALTIHRHRLLPEGWIAGFIRFKSVSEVHQNYLLGQVRESGWWYYFPLAVVFKMPLATLLAGAGASLVLTVSAWCRRIGLAARQRLAIVCCAVAAIVYLAAAMPQNINHGVRHLLPLYPLAFILISIVTARCVSIWRRATFPIAI